MNRFFIYAGNHEQAKALAHKMKLTPREWAYVYSRDNLMGLDGGTLIVTGSWRDRDDEDWISIIETAQTRRMKILYDES